MVRSSRVAPADLAAEDAAFHLEGIVERPDVPGAVCRIVVPSAEVLRRYGRRGRVPVVATINGHTFRNSLTPRRGSHMLPLSAEVRAAAGVADGERIALSLREDLAERTVEVPEDFVAELHAAGVLATFEAMSFSHRKEWVRAVADAKRAETRRKRIADCVAAMRGR